VWGVVIGLLLIFYALFILYVSVKRPELVWDTYKIKYFRRIFGEKGASVFLFICFVIIAIIGIVLLNK